MHVEIRSRGACLAAIAASVLLTACAGSVPKAEFDHAIPVQYRVAGNDKAEVSVSAVGGVKILPVDEERIREVIKAKLDERRAANPANTVPRACSIEVLITRYQRGNAFARAMLAGLGQIHIDATVTATDQASHQTIDEFKIAKTFAWGGIYGAATSMEDIERTFADGVAAALTGQEEAKKSPAAGPTTTETKKPAAGR